jgi:hypothetical protein
VPPGSGLPQDRHGAGEKDEKKEKDRPCQHHAEDDFTKGNTSWASVGGWGWSGYRGYHGWRANLVKGGDNNRNALPGQSAGILPGPGDRTAIPGAKLPKI